MHTRRSMTRGNSKEQEDGPKKRETRSMSVASSTPSSKSYHRNRNMRDEDIEKDLDDSDSGSSEIFTARPGKDEHLNNIDDDSKITITIRRSSVDNEYKAVIGSKKRTVKTPQIPPETSRSARERRSLYNNLNEKVLFSNEKQFKQTPKTSTKKTTRKRSAKTSKNTDGASSEEESDGSVEADENDQSAANSPSKRLKPAKYNQIPRTPHKDKVQTSHMTPTTKLAKNMSNLNFTTPSKTPNESRGVSSAKKNLYNTPSQTKQKVYTVNKPLQEIDSETNNVNRYSLRNKTPFSYHICDSEEDKTSGSSYDENEDSESSDEDEEGASEAESNDSQSPKRQKTGKKDFTTRKKQFVKGVAKTPRTPRTPSATSKISMDTPTKALSRLSLTPSVHQRTVNIAKPSTPLQEARMKLHVSVLPKSLPCREEQFNDIYTFLHARLADKSGGCIYISGVPGTGKTATVNEVIRCLKKAMTAGKLTEFDFIDVNGMKLSEPRQAYVQIWKQLEKDPSTKTITWEAAQKALHERFTKPNSKRKMTLLLVDELDLLCTKRQDVVYNLLDWPSKIGAKLVVVTIANTMDLPERILMGKVTSRLGLTRLTFPPYNHRQLEEIVVSRLKGYDAFGGETIQLVARKVAAVSGDARRALDICRRATEIAEANDREVVSMMDVKKALDEMIASPKIQAIKHCSEYEKVFLQAVCTEVNRTGVEEVVFKNVYHQLETLCTFNGEKSPTITEALDMCSRLGSWRLLLCDHSRMDIHQRLLLNVTTDDVHFATQAIET